MKKRIAALCILLVSFMFFLGVLFTDVTKEYWRYDEFSGRDRIFYAYDRDTAFFVIQDLLAIPVETWGDCSVSSGGLVITSVTTPCLKSNIYFVHFWNWAVAFELGTLDGHIAWWGYFGYKMGVANVVETLDGMEEKLPDDGMLNGDIEDDFNPDLIPV